MSQPIKPRWKSRYPQEGHENFSFFCCFVPREAGQEWRSCPVSGQSQISSTWPGIPANPPKHPENGTQGRLAGIPDEQQPLLPEGNSCCFSFSQENTGVQAAVAAGESLPGTCKEFPGAKLDPKLKFHRFRGVQGKEGFGILPCPWWEAVEVDNVLPRGQ